MFKKLLLSMAMIVLCLSARAEESAEAGKARIDMQFKEGGGEGAPKDSGAVYAGEGRKHNLKLAQVVAKRPQALEVPAPGVFSSSDSYKAAECVKSRAPLMTGFGAVVGSTVGAAVGVLAVGVGVVPGAVVGGTIAAFVARGTSVMLCRVANGISAFGS